MTDITAGDVQGRPDMREACRDVRVEATDCYPGYALLDSGDGRKLERFGRIVVDRPEPQALWSPRRTKETWAAADAKFAATVTDDERDAGRWELRHAAARTWPVAMEGITIECRFTAFRHIGVFPEQRSNWLWVERMLSSRGGMEAPNILNLFGYTGLASLLAARKGANVVHVDASKRAVEWGRTNQRLAGLDHLPIRWIVDDARGFTEREVRRNRLYQGIILDPPKFGRGPDKQVWDLFSDLPQLLQACNKLLDPAWSFLILTTYAVRASSMSFAQLAGGLLAHRAGRCENGELAVLEENDGRLLPAANFFRWKSDAVGA